MIHFHHMKKEKNKYNSLLQNMALFTISSFGSKIIVFLMVPLYTYILSTEDYGTLDLIASTASLLIPVLTLNIQDAVMRFVMDKEYKSEDVISTGMRIVLLGTMILAGVLIFFKTAHILVIHNKLLIFLFFSYFLGALNNCFSLYLKGQERVGVLAVSGLINSVLMCSLNIVMLVICKMGLSGYMLSNVIALASTVLYQFFAGRIYREVRIQKYKNLSKPMIAYSRPLVGNSIAWWINNVSDRYILTFIQGVTINGIYSVSYKIPAILSMVQGIFNSAWSISAITEFDPEDKDGFIGSTYGVYAWISMLACSAIMIINIPLAKILYAKDFFVAWQYVPFLLVGTMFNGMALFQGCLFTAAKKTKEVSRSTIAGAIVNTLGNILFISLWGAQGAAFATLLGYLITWIMRMVLLRKIVRMKLNWIKHLLSCILLVIQACFALQNIWIVESIIFLAVFMLQREYLQMLLKRVKVILSK